MVMIASSERVAAYNRIKEKVVGLSTLLLHYFGASGHSAIPLHTDSLTPSEIGSPQQETSKTGVYRDA